MRVWVVDDQASFRRATAATLASMDDFVMAGECETGETAIEQSPDGDADIVLMDIHMPGMGGIEATRQIRAGLNFAAQISQVIVAVSSTISSSLKCCLTFLNRSSGTELAVAIDSA